MIDIDLYKIPDLHIHSIYSDGSDTPSELIENVKKAGVDIFALTDHDAYAGCQKVRELLQPGDPYFIGGVELSCRDTVGKCHILGYAYDISKIYVVELINKMHKARMTKAENRFNFLKEKFGIVFTEDELQEIMKLKNPGKPHIANLMVKKGIATRDRAFEILNKFRDPGFQLTPEEAIDAILKSDGIPVLAHGILGEGSENLSAEAIEERVVRLKGEGLMGLECYYSKYTPEQQEIMLSLAKKYNLLVTAGSDYHGKNKSVKLGETNSPSPEVMKRFYLAVGRLLEE